MCGIRTDRSIVCWGDHSQGNLHAPEGGFTHVSAGWDHTCAIRTDRTIVCWDWGSLYDQTDSRKGNSPEYRPVGTTPAGYAPTTRSAAGAATRTARPTPRKGNSSTYRPMTTTRVEFAPTEPSHAGAGRSHLMRSMPLKESHHPGLRLLGYLGAANRPDHHMLGSATRAVLKLANDDNTRRGPVEHSTTGTGVGTSGQCRTAVASPTAPAADPRAMSPVTITKSPSDTDSAAAR